VTPPAAAPIVNFSFPHLWQAEILPARPAILPARHFTYPRHAEEIERGALEALVRPANPDSQPGARGLASETGEIKSISSPNWNTQPFLATCALGFRDPAVPTGLWSTPNPEELCAVSGGYAYLILTTAPERFTMIPYRPVLQVLSSPANNLLLFLSNRTILAWGQTGQLWESEKLSDEGLTITSLEIRDATSDATNILCGLGWQMKSDQEIPFALDLRTGLCIE
jgi:hypothetical protein